MSMTLATTQTAIHDGVSLAGDIASAGNHAESGTEVGFGGGPVGTVVDGVVGGVPGEVPASPSRQLSTLRGPGGESPCS
ncbi:hypothetical protein [Streptomyces sp. NPDC086787]|uniref:hypothetical protein n=1 Tax=Streptomyces sp. NPDC086787 TaxID=3365759 RepID=UPI003823DBCF